MQNQHRQLAAILFTDIVGYTALMQENEQKAVALIKHYNAALNELVGLHNGKVLNYYGDGSLCTFSSVTEALNCAIELQKELQSEPTVPLRIGLHVGEVFFEYDKALGDGVNVASRIQSLGQANTILFSKEIFDKIRNQPEFKSISLGSFEFKNVDQPIEVFALANEGLNVPKRENMDGKLKTSLQKGRRTVQRKIIAAVTIVLLLVAGYFIYSMFFKNAGFTGNEKSIAVLPFASMNNENETESFSMGISTEITNQLQKIGSLDVRAASSTIRFKDEKIKSLKDIAAELNVAAIVTGLFQKTSDKISVTVELTDVNSNKVIWTKNFNSDWQDIFSIQNEIAEQVVFELNSEMTKDEKKKIEKKPTNNTDAYDYYLQASYLGGKFFETFDKDYYENSKIMYEKAISIDPNYALAHAGLADLYNSYYFINKDSVFLTLQQQEIEKAWSIDPTLDDVNLVRGYVLQADNKLEEAYKSFRRAIELAPNNPNNIFGLAQMLLTFGLVDEAKTLAEKSIRLNPLSANDFSFHGATERSLFNLDNAIKDLQTALRLEPDLLSALVGLGGYYCLKDKLEDAKNILLKYEKLNRHVEVLSGGIAYIYAKLGDKKKALELSKDWEVYLALGMTEDCLTVLLKNDSATNKQFESNSYIYFKNYSQHKDFDLIRNDPRFLELMEKKRIQYEINKKKFSVAGLLN